MEGMRDEHNGTAKEKNAEAGRKAKGDETGRTDDDNARRQND